MNAAGNKGNMMRKLMMIGLLGLAPATAAYAAPSVVPTQITYTQGSNALYTTSTIFENFDSYPAGNFTSGTGLPSGISESSTGRVLIQAANTSNPDGVAPSNDTSQYLSITNGGTFTVSFAGIGAQVFSFYLGTLDNFNTVTLNFKDGTQNIYTGTALVGSTGNALLGTSGRVTYDAKGGSGISSAVLSSSNNSFEIDDLAAAAPEPATWALMILGFGLIGTQLRARRRKVAVSFA